MKETDTSISYDELVEYKHKDLVYRMMKKYHLTSSDAEQLFLDTKMFLYLCYSEDGNFAPPQMIDECWHNFILFTKDYAEFCDTYFSEFIHHQPHGINFPLDRHRYLMDRTIKTAKLKFGQLSKNWIFQKDTSTCNDSCTPSTDCQPPPPPACSN